MDELGLNFKKEIEMKKIFVGIAILATLSLTGCGFANRAISGYTGNATESCHDGIMYLQWTTGSTVKIDKNTLQPARCN